MKNVAASVRQSGLTVVVNPTKKTGADFAPGDKQLFHYQCRTRSFIPLQRTQNNRAFRQQQPWIDNRGGIMPPF